MQLVALLLGWWRRSCHSFPAVFEFSELYFDVLLKHALVIDILGHTLFPTSQNHDALSSSQDGPRGYGCTTSVPPVLLIFFPSIPALFFEPRVDISDLQNSVRRNDVGLTTVFILPAKRYDLMAQVVSRSHVVRGKLVGRPFAWAGKLSGGFPSRGDPALDSLE